jgi:pimeloyl-ACP methyl ester carboxylesterase
MHSHSKRCKIFFVALVVSSSAYGAEENPKNTKVIDDPAYTHAQRLVEVEHGRRLNLYCLGKGSPTVVFESGLTDETDVWALVQPAIAIHTRACSYDRAGVGYSDPGRRENSSANIADDLHRLLAAASIKPPYILVGHSTGGMHVRLFADKYLSEVVGMVLIDPSHEDWWERAWKLNSLQLSREQYFPDEPEFQRQRKCVKAAAADLLDSSDTLRKCIPPPDPRYGDAINAAYRKTHLSVGYQQAQLTEEETYQHASADQVRAAQRWYGEMPLIVLSSTPRGPRADETQAHRDAINRVWVSLFDQLAALSKRGVVRPVPNSDHNIQMTQPDAVNTAILEVLREATQAK